MSNIRLTETKLFIDGGDPTETAEATHFLTQAGYKGLDGQTTNPSLVAKNPDIVAKIKADEKLTAAELLQKYKEIVQDIEKSAAGEISIEVYADQNTTAEEMVAQAREMGTWIQSRVIKLPTTEQGLLAAEQLKGELPLNLTLCFSQQQAAAIYSATQGSAYPVFISPFIGRLDDRGENGIDLVANILRMVGHQSHVQILTASIRSVEHILGALALGTHALTLPFAKAFKPWAEKGFPLPGEDYEYHFNGSPIPYEELDLAADWRSFDLHHDLTAVGLQKFVDDWNSLLDG
ncbi:MAG: transaldolase [Candidatus Andersenbacteria bacterium]|nr:transaldolase [Candidatus Andersenbacteria bacterium]MBI3251089.1 transaldolase [Candidatus Andersenbacteria bacterium]